MVLPRPEGGFFTTEALDRTYKTERGAKQAERMFQNPELWKNNLFYQYTHSVDTYIDEVSEMTYDEMDLLSEAGLTEDDINWILEEDDFFEEEEEEEEEEEVFINWYEIPLSLRRMISELPSNSACKERLLSNEWAGVYLSDIIADFGEDIASDYFPEYF